MRVKVQTHGHQHYNEVEGEVVQWCSAVEHYSRGNESKPFQVPAVMINTGDAVVLVALQKDLYWTRVEVLDADKAS